MTSASRRAARALGAVLALFALWGGTGAALHTAAATPVAVRPHGPGGHWRLVFSDGFTGRSLGPHWADYWVDHGSMNGVRTAASNASVSGGQLRLRLSARRTGALVSTNPRLARRGFSFRTGYYAEARIFFPGHGLVLWNWPSWWTDGQHWPDDGEIDIAEGLRRMTTNYHCLGPPYNSPPVPGHWASGWHTYGVYRQTGHNTVYYDGGAPQYLIFNIGTRANAPTALGARGALRVDWVRVWRHLRR
jgi:hypothetical protein